MLPPRSLTTLSLILFAKLPTRCLGFPRLYPLSSGVRPPPSSQNNKPTANPPSLIRTATLDSKKNKERGITARAIRKVTEVSCQYSSRPFLHWQKLMLGVAKFEEIQNLSEGHRNWQYGILKAFQGRVNCERVVALWSEKALSDMGFVELERRKTG